MSSNDVQFLLCAMEHSNAGKVDWKAVGEALGIKQGAAYMRFSRLKQRHGITSSTPGTTSSPEGSGDADGSPKPAKKTPKKPSKPSKKRKLSDSEQTEVQEPKQEPVEQENDEWA